MFASLDPLENLTWKCFSKHWFFKPCIFSASGIIYSCQIINAFWKKTHFSLALCFCFSWYFTNKVDLAAGFQLEAHKHNVTASAPLCQGCDQWWLILYMAPMQSPRRLLRSSMELSGRAAAMCKWCQSDEITPGVFPKTESTLVAFTIIRCEDSVDLSSVSQQLR